MKSLRNGLDSRSLGTEQSLGTGRSGELGLLWQSLYASLFLKGNYSLKNVFIPLHHRSNPRLGACQVSALPPSSSFSPKASL